MGHGIKYLFVHGGASLSVTAVTCDPYPMNTFRSNAPAVANVSARMATAPSEPLPQRLAAIRGQLKLLSDYL